MRFTILASSLALLLTTAAVAQTTGRLAGEARDSTGAALPGVIVTVQSPSQIGGTQTTTTDGDGAFQYPRLTPGVYVVRLDLDGFVSQERSAVEVRLNGTTELHVTMASASFGDEVIVTTETPVVDTEQVSMTQTYTEEFLQATSIGSTNRSYNSVFDQAAGATSSGGNAMVFGSTTDENTYLVDGIDTTDPVTATFGIQLNFDAIQEMAFHTGGFEAEFGRATGGVVNVITKSGGNAFSGTLDGRYRDTSFTQSGDHFDPDSSKNEQLDVNATLGGPILQDKFWFFLAGQVFDAERTNSGDPVALKVESNTWLAKGTWQLTPSWQVIGKYSADPADFSNIVGTPQDTLDTLSFQEQGGDLFSLSLDGIISPFLFWDIKAQALRQELNAFPQSGDLDTPGILDLATNVSSQNYTNAQFSDRDRDELRSTLTYFADELAGSHEFKAGVEYTDLFFRSSNNTTGELIFYDDSSVVGPYLFQTFPDASQEEDTGEVLGGFVQDSWRITSQVTVKAGIRYDDVSYDTDAGGQVATLDKLQPRLGFAWDITGDGKTVARGSVGRFMHPNALTLPSFARNAVAPPSEQWVSCSWTEAITGLPTSQCSMAPILFGVSSNPGVIISDPTGHDPAGWWKFGDLTSGAPNEIDPNISAMYSDQILIGVERELYDRTSLELTYIKKETDDIFEDTCNGNIAGRDPNAACDFYVMANLPELTREYEGVTLQFETRHPNWLNLKASYTWSESKGSVEGTQNAGVDYDYFPAHFENRYGYLSDDRRNRFKLTGFVLMPWDTSLGFNGFWSDKAAYNVTESAVTAGLAPYGRHFIEPRGSRRFEDPRYNLDLQLTKGIELGSVRAQLIAAIFNTFDSEQVTTVCTNIEGCGSASVGDALNYSRPRSFEAGIRFEF
ncbi:MAG: TonB-dependent receptor [Thermoanaerobaculia bacterium]|nr:TonB-dependent receptor [Thermoanaerobaculia bacterium]